MNFFLLTEFAPFQKFTRPDRTSSAPRARNIVSIIYLARVTQSIFRPASGRTGLGANIKRDRHDGGLKICWTKPWGWAWPMGIGSGLGLGQRYEVGGNDKRVRCPRGSGYLQRVIMTSGERDHCFKLGSAEPIWQRCSRRLVRPSSCGTVGSRTESDPLHHEVSLIGVTCLCGLRGKISMTSMRPW